MNVIGDFESHQMKEMSKKNGPGAIEKIKTQTLMETELDVRGAYQDVARMCDRAHAKILRIGAFNLK